MRPGALCSVKPVSDYGERDRIRTCDPVIKSHLLYQLSYAPVIVLFNGQTHTPMALNAPLYREDIIGCKPQKPYIKRKKSGEKFGFFTGAERLAFVCAFCFS
jgi:hypothetical protein